MTQLSPILFPRLDDFLLGFIVATSLVALLFFIRFWKSTRDPLFLAFGIFFAVQGVTRSAGLGLQHPNEGAVWIFAVRLLSVLGVLAAILWKNLRR
ncbi:hypothetical protein DYQ86_26960 [Acidobacteria bacterium AB60]|nr:hypothetical protein DYQ86_26960 [Acidobacteria bacterium AB60]